MPSKWKARLLADGTINLLEIRYEGMEMKFTNKVLAATKPKEEGK